MEEIWKDIKDYEGYYQVSSFGRIKSLSRKLYCGKGFYITKEKFLIGGIDKSGYHYINLWGNRIQKTKSIHRLVAETFIDNPKNKDSVNHIDGNKKNNHICNLEWCDIQDNLKHSWRIGLRDEQKRKLYKQVYQIDLHSDKIIKDWNCISDAARKLNIPRGNITRCCKNKVKSAGGYKWKYK